MPALEQEGEGEEEEKRKRKRNAKQNQKETETENETEKERRAEETQIVSKKRNIITTRSARDNTHLSLQTAYRVQQATRTYLLTQGKFRITPSKLMASLEVARATNSRPLSAPASVRRRRAPAPPKAGETVTKEDVQTRFRIQRLLPGWVCLLLLSSTALAD